MSILIVYIALQIILNGKSPAFPQQWSLQQQQYNAEFPKVLNFFLNWRMSFTNVFVACEPVCPSKSFDSRLLFDFNDVMFSIRFDVASQVLSILRA